MQYHTQGRKYSSDRSQEMLSHMLRNVEMSDPEKEGNGLIFQHTIDDDNE
jgi:hypothetical protein